MSHICFSSSFCVDSFFFFHSFAGEELLQSGDTLTAGYHGDSYILTSVLTPAQCWDEGEGRSFLWPWGSYRLFVSSQGHRSFRHETGQSEFHLISKWKLISALSWALKHYPACTTSLVHVLHFLSSSLRLHWSSSSMLLRTKIKHAGRR